MGRFKDRSRPRGLVLSAVATLMIVVASRRNGNGGFPTAADAFAPHRPPSRSRDAAAARSPSAPATSLRAMNRQNKFNKQNDLAAKMAEAKRLRELAEGGGDGDSSSPQKQTIDSEGGDEMLSAGEVKLRNDRRRFADLLDNSMTGGSGDMEKGYYMTEQQENENADAMFRGVVRLYEGDPAPTTPFAELLDSETGQPLGAGGMRRLVPWEGSQSTASADHLVVVADPRPKSAELRTAMKRLSGALGADDLRRCAVVNADTPAENRRFAKKNLAGDGGSGGKAGSGTGPSLRILCDENLDWMREYTALGEKRFSITVFVLRNGRVEKIAREVEAEVLSMVAKNAIRSL